MIEERERENAYRRFEGRKGMIYEEKMKLAFGWRAGRNIEPLFGIEQKRVY